ncbi:MAG: hypothetical protein KDB27_07840 [Planctomycetales bacterium]|nr:hypothetical protein [Planctomycetales bacterium]
MTTAYAIRIILLTILFVQADGLSFAPRVSDDLDSAARQYRIRTYDRLRSNRDSYDQQIGRLEKLLSDVARGRVKKQDAVRKLDTDLQVATPKATAGQRPKPVKRSVVAKHQPERLTDPIVIEQVTNGQPSFVAAFQRPPDPFIDEDISNATVNVAVLTAQIESTNLKLETIEGLLHPQSSPRLFPDELIAMADELEQARQRQEVSKIYLDLLSPAARQQIPELVNVKPIVSLLARRLFDAQIHAHERLASSPNEQHTHDVELLQQLSRRIRQWQNP